MYGIPASQTAQGSSLTPKNTPSTNTRTETQRTDTGAICGPPRPQWGNLELQPVQDWAGPMRNGGGLVTPRPNIYTRTASAPHRRHKPAKRKIQRRVVHCYIRRGAHPALCASIATGYRVRPLAHNMYYVNLGARNCHSIRGRNRGRALAFLHRGSSDTLSSPLSQKSGSSSFIVAKSPRVAVGARCLPPVGEGHFVVVAQGV
jgi:hypothetical protein